MILEPLHGLLKITLGSIWTAPGNLSRLQVIRFRGQNLGTAFWGLLVKIPLKRG
jgi:hypothetical protein